jgi:hypothetical protein
VEHSQHLEEISLSQTVMSSQENISGTSSSSRFLLIHPSSLLRLLDSREYGIQFSPPVTRPPLPDTNHGAANSTGLQSVKHLSSTSNGGKKGHGTRSMDYFAKKQELQKTQQFLACSDSTCLRFDCIDWVPPSRSRSSSANTPTPPRSGDRILLNGSEKHYTLVYSLTDNMIEVRTKKFCRLSADEPTLLLKKTKLPKNWRNESSGSRGRKVQSATQSEWYTLEDFLIGKTVDVYGKVLLLVSCDNSTQKYYQQHLHQSQQPIQLQYPEEKNYPVEVPALGDGYLPIGSEEDTLHTVMGHPKPSKNWKKIQRNLGQIIRCRCRMITENLIDMTRIFDLTFYLEDDTLAIYEENIRNSGVMGGYYLKRGSYINELPPELANTTSATTGAPGDEQDRDRAEILPRPYVPTDIYLGNILGVNGSMYQVIEMDDLSIRFCEENCDEFPYFDTLAIIQHVIGKVLAKRIDLREYIERYHDVEERYWIDDREFVSCLEEIDIIGEMNDQEVMTVMRRFKEVLEGNMIQRKINRQRDGGGGGGGTSRGSARSGNTARGGAGGGGGERYFYHEFCDLFSYASHIENGTARRARGRRANGGRGNGRSEEQLDLLLDEMRGKQTQWRRSAPPLPFLLSFSLPTELFAKMVTPLRIATSPVLSLPQCSQRMA